MGSSDTRRVQFRAPEDLVDRTDALATVLETDRTDVLTSALREYLREASHDDDIVQEIADAYYADEITFDQLTGLVGHKAAANFRVLKTQLDDAFVDATADELSE